MSKKIVISIVALLVLASAGIFGAQLLQSTPDRTNEETTTTKKASQNDTSTSSEVDGNSVEKESSNHQASSETSSVIVHNGDEAVALVKEHLELALMNYTFAGIEMEIAKS
jgi:cytoskeletal protein RodZ